MARHLTLLLHTDDLSPVNQSHEVESETRPRQCWYTTVRRRFFVRVELLQTHDPLGDMPRSMDFEVLNCSSFLLPILLLGLYVGM